MKYHLCIISNRFKLFICTFSYYERTRMAPVIYATFLNIMSFMNRPCLLFFNLFLIWTWIQNYVLINVLICFDGDVSLQICNFYHTLRGTWSVLASWRARLSAGNPLIAIYILSLFCSSHFFSAPFSVPLHFFTSLVTNCMRRHAVFTNEKVLDIDK